ncbi:MAG: FKBP-type peptidyl-prolyl cis-trans isomerase [Fusobacteria bacterium]|nr:FKBP-type peptidyl-prolyl cis-trans isomerase [Fusobacteriota bacterium]
MKKIMITVLATTFVGMAFAATASKPAAPVIPQAKINSTSATMTTTTAVNQNNSGTAALVQALSTVSGGSIINAKPSTMSLTTDQQKTGYALGTYMAFSIQQSGFPATNSSVYQGAQDALAGNAKVSYSQAQTIIQQSVNMLKSNQVTSLAQQRQLGYAVGVSVVTSIKNSQFQYDQATFIAGLQDTLNRVPRMSSDQVTNILNAAANQFQSNQSQGGNVSAQDNLQKGQAFLAQNAKQTGVVTLPDGLQYKVVVQGKGAKPKATDTVTVNYEGTTIDGKVFDSSYQRGTPISFALNQVIPGWTEGVQLMTVGSTYMFYIPANLAYGNQQVGPYIGPNSTLIFKVELIKIN